MRVLFDEEDRRPLGVDLADDAEDRLHHLRRQAERRLVEEQHLRLRHQRARDGQHLLLAAGERSGVLLDALLQHREEREDPLVLRLLDLVLAQVGAELEVVAHGEVREDAAPLGHVRDAHRRDHVRLHAGDVLCRRT